MEFDRNTDFENLSSRKLNEIERTCYLLDRGSPFVSMICAHLNGKISDEMLGEAAEIVRKRHYYLNFSIEEENNWPIFVYKKNARIEIETVKKMSKSTWIDIAEEKINNSFKLKKAPLMHIVQIQIKKNESIIEIIMSHIISDGIGVFNFLKDLLSVLAELQKGNKIADLPVLPSIYPSFAIFPEIGKVAINSEKAEYLEITKSYIEMKDRKSRVIDYDFSFLKSKKIIQKCKLNGITIHSLLGAALILSMRDYIIKKYRIQNPFWIKSSSGINLRNYLNQKIDPSQLGLFSGFGYLNTVVNSETNLIDLARKYKDELNSLILSHQPFQGIREIAFLSKNISPMEFALKRESKLPYVILTNLGKLDIAQEYGNIRIKRISFITPMHRNWVNDLGFGGIFNTFDNKLNCNFIYMEPAMNKITAKQMINRIIQYVLE